MNQDADLLALAILTLRDSVMLLVHVAQQSGVDHELETDEAKKMKAVFAQTIAQREMLLINLINQRQQQAARNEMAAVMAPPPKIVRP